MLVYLHGALCEALRLFPPGPANPRSPQEADTLPSGRQVHTHTRIVLHPYAMGRMETIWGPDCLEFRPERWISEQGGIKHMPSYKFTAFHSGPRTCLGKDMSLIHMKMVAATIIYNYNVQVVEGHPTTQDPSMILQMKYGLMHTIPIAQLHQPGQQVPPEALAAHAAWVKGQKEVVFFMRLTWTSDISRILVSAWST
ncbi:cytochrome P450 [Tanacetum coccineum]